MSWNTRWFNKGGVSTVRDRRYSPGPSLWDGAPVLAARCEPGKYHIYEEDFDRYVAGDWTVTEVNNSTQALTDAAGGVLLITNAGADNDSTQMQKVGESWKLAASKPLWFETNVYVSDVDDCDFLIGLAITDTTLIAGNSDGVNFRLTEGSAALSFVTEKNSTETTTAAVATLADSTFVRLGFYCDGVTAVYAYVNGVLVATHTANICDDEELTVSYAFQNGSATAMTSGIDGFWGLQVK